MHPVEQESAPTPVEQGSEARTPPEGAAAPSTTDEVVRVLRALGLGAMLGALLAAAARRTG